MIRRLKQSGRIKTDELITITRGPEEANIMEQYCLAGIVGELYGAYGPPNTLPGGFLQ